MKKKICITFTILFGLVILVTSYFIIFIKTEAQFDGTDNFFLDNYLDSSDFDKTYKDLSTYYNINRREAKQILEHPEEYTVLRINVKIVNNTIFNFLDYKINILSLNSKIITEKEEPGHYRYRVTDSKKDYEETILIIVKNDLNYDTNKLSDILIIPHRFWINGVRNHRFFND